MFLSFGETQYLSYLEYDLEIESKHSIRLQELLTRRFGSYLLILWYILSFLSLPVLAILILPSNLLIYAFPVIILILPVIVLVVMSDMFVFLYKRHKLLAKRVTNNEIVWW